MKTEYGTLIKSDNALAAEGQGRFNGTEICRKLKLPTEIIPDLPWDGEWHHASAYANRIDYFDLEAVRSWLATDKGQAALQGAKLKRKAKKDASKIEIQTDVVVSWPETTTVWKNGRPRSGDPIWRKVKAKEVRTHPDKAMAEIVLEDGEVIKKKKFSITVVNQNG